MSTLCATPELQVMTFYGGTPDELHGWTNVLRNSIDACSNKTITEDWKMKILVQLSGKIFDRTERSLYAEWQNATDEFIAELKPHVASGKALGVFMGEFSSSFSEPLSESSSGCLRPSKFDSSSASSANSAKASSSTSFACR